MKNKRQHFVPQHYLRQFRIDGTNLIATSLVQPYRFIGPTAINKQCQSSYFYGADGELDQVMSQFEINLAPLLKSVSEKRSFDSAELPGLQMLAALLHVRTRKAVEKAKLFPKRVALEFFNAGIKSGRLPAPKGGLTEDMIDFDGVADELIKTALIPAWMEMHTLECKLLAPAQDSFFVTSDEPVIMMNEYAARLNGKREFVGFAQSGFQLLLPLSPTLCAFFYDPGIYKVGNRKDKLVTLSPSDVEILNSLHLQSAENCIYFHSVSLEARMAALNARYGRLRKPLSDLVRTLPGWAENDEILHIRSEGAKLPTAWRFCQYRKNLRRKVGERRNPDWTATIMHLEDDMIRNPGIEDITERVERMVAEAKVRTSSVCDQ